MSAALTVVIPAFNARERLGRCLDSLLTQSRPAEAIIVVDDASTDGTAAFVGKQYPQVEVIAVPVNRGFCHAVNRGLRAATTDAVMTLNDDMTLAPDCLERLMAAWSPGRIVGPLIVFDSDPDTVYAAGDRLLTNGRPESIGFREPRAGMTGIAAIAGITAGAAVYPREALLRAGAFDERFVAYFDDMDVSLRCRWIGIEPVLVSEAIARHEGGASIAGRSWWRTRQCWRNHALLVVKHWPLRLMLRHAGPILAECFAGMRRTFGAVRADRGGLRALASVAGVWLSGCVLMPHALRARWRIARMRTVPARSFAAWLTTTRNDA